MAPVVQQRSDDPIATAALVALAEARTERTAAILLDQYHGALRRAIDKIRRDFDRGDTSAANNGSTCSWLANNSAAI